MKKRILLLVIFIGCSLSLVKAQTELHSNEQNSSADSILIIKQALANKYTINSEGYFIFGDTIECELSKEILFNNAKLWLGNFHKDYNNEVKYEDFSTGTIIVKTKIIDNNITPYLKRERIIDFNMTIRVKDKKFLYNIEPLKDKVIWFEKNIGSSSWIPYHLFNNSPKMIKGYNYIPNIIEQHLFEYKQSNDIECLKRAIEQFKEYDFIFLTFQIISEGFKLSMTTDNDF